MSVFSERNLLTINEMIWKSLLGRVNYMDIVERTKDLIDKSKTILVVSGAGISTGAGIPDFRSAGGIYETVSKEY
ncbi:MAG: Sir2 family NAD-dependent protein deacetylase, partial [Spirochaetota bacterium]